VLFIFRLSLEYGRAIEKANQLIGYTNPRRALPGTIRWDLFHEDENLSSIDDEDGFLYNLIDLCKSEEHMAEAMVTLVPENDLRKCNFLSHIKI
jgi:nucleoside diphosphate kinase